MENRNTLAMRLLQARSHGIPAVVAGYAQIMSTATENLSPLVLLACGDVLSLDYLTQTNAYMTWLSRPFVAEALAQRWAAQNGIRDTEMIIARTYGELVGTSMVRSKNSVGDRNRARANVSRILKMHPPSLNEVRSLVVEIVKKCKSSVDQYVDGTEVAQFVPGGKRVSQQTAIFYQQRGQLLPSIIFEQEDARRAWNLLSDTDTNWVELDDTDFNLIESVPTLWPGFTADTHLGYYEAKATQTPDKSRSLIGGAVFTYLTSLAKESNITMGWVQRRKRQLLAKIPELSVDTYITDGVIKHFVRMYAPLEPSWEEVYRQLVVCWSVLQCPEGQSLSWIIEQSSNNNVTCLITIADVTTRLQYFDVDLLMRKGIPPANFQYSLTLARDLLRNPFCSLVKPTIPLRQYADLAYPCTYERDNSSRSFLCTTLVQLEPR